MKICYLSDASSVHTKKWCSIFTSLGHEIYVISLNDGEIPGVIVHSLKVKLENIRKENVINKLNYFKYVSVIKRLVSEINPDILHAHYATSYGFLGSCTDFHPYIISVWGSDVYDFPRKNIICRKFIERNLGKADLILSTSVAMAEETRKYTDKSIEITPFGVDIDVFRPLENKYADKVNIIIGTVKTLEPIYGIDYLIKAFGNLCKNHDNITLEIAGTGSQRESLEKLCSDLGITDKVTFLGYISQDKVVEAFNRFDVAVIPSNFESFGVSAVEAQACGTAVIVSDAGGLPEATCPNKSSIVVERGNISQLQDAIDKLTSNKELRDSMGKYGRKYVIEKYNVKDNFNEVNIIYKGLLKK